MTTRATDGKTGKEGDDIKKDKEGNHGNNGSEGTGGEGGDQGNGKDHGQGNDDKDHGNDDGGNSGKGNAAKDLTILSGASGISEDHTTATLQDMAGIVQQKSFFSLQTSVADPAAQPTQFAITALGAKVSIDASGNVQYDASAIADSLQHMNQDDKLLDSFSYTLKSGNGNGKATSATVSVEIAGMNDAPVLPATTKLAVNDTAADDTPGVLAGKLGAKDVDDHAILTYTVLSQSGSGGSVTLNPDGSYAFTADPDAIDTLNARQSLTTTLLVEVTDQYGASSTGSVNFAVQGANDTAVIAGDAFGEVLLSQSGFGNANYLPAVGELTVQDRDTGEARFSVDGTLDPRGHEFIQRGHHGFFDLDPASGTWEYTLDSSTDVFKALTADEDAVEKFTVRSLDGSASKEVAITVHGRNDAAHISGADQVFTVDEDGVLATGGKVSVADPDKGQSVFQPVAGLHGTYGDFSFDGAKGDWAYTLRNGDANVQALGADEVVHDSLHLVSLDGSAEADLVIDITGRNDMIVNDDAASVTVDAPFASIDVRANDTGVASVLVQGTSALGAMLGVNPDGTLVYEGKTLDQGTLAALKQDEHLTDSFDYTAVGEDGSQKVGHVSVDIIGKNDAPTIQGDPPAALADSAYPDIHTTRSGVLTITDPDSRLMVAVAGEIGNAGSLTVDPDGSYVYTLPDGVLDAMQAGDSGQDKFVVSVTDEYGASASMPLVFDRSGADDRLIISPARKGAPQVAEDGLGGPMTAVGSTLARDPDSASPAPVFTAGQLFAAEDPAGELGSFNLNAQGEWNFVLNNDAAAVQALKSADSNTLHFDVHTTDHQASYTQAVRVRGADDTATISPPTTLSLMMGTTDSLSGTLSVSDPDLNEAGMVSGPKDEHFQYGYWLSTTTNTGPTSTVSWNYYVQNDVFLAAAVDASPDSIVVDRMTLGSLDGSVKTTLEIAINGSKTYLGTLGAIEHFDANDMLKQNFSSADTTIFLGSQQVMATDSTGNQVASTQLNFKVLSFPVFGSTIDLPHVVLVGYTGWHDYQLT